jgi:hypothetical protein
VEYTDCIGSYKSNYGYEYSCEFSNYSKQNQNTRKHGKYESGRNLQHT